MTRPDLDDEAADWAAYLVSLAKDGRMSLAQALQLARLVEGSFNEFDGFKVTADLLDNRHLWAGCVFTRAWSEADPGDEIRPLLTTDLIELRDVSRGINADTLYVLTEGPDNAAKLQELAKKWHADEVDVYDTDAAARWLGGGADKKGHVVRIWWD